MHIDELTTPRLILRRFRDSDLEPFVAMNADPEVMAHYPKTMTREESVVQLERIATHFEKFGYGVWAVEHRDTHAFVGAVGIFHSRFEAHFTPCVELFWRLARAHWGSGFATEAAYAARDVGIDRLRFPEIVAFTSEQNKRSRRVMERIGMSRNPADDFDHPSVPPGHPLSRHVLYRYRKSTKL